mgnify:CR=1 FL=1
MGRLAEAEAMTKKALREACEVALYNLGQCYRKMRRLDAAVDMPVGKLGTSEQSKKTVFWSTAGGSMRWPGVWPCLSCFSALRLPAVRRG